VRAISITWAARHFVGRDGRLYALTPDVRARGLVTGPGIGTEMQRHAINLRFWGLRAADAKAIQQMMTPEERARMREDGYPNAYGIVAQMRRDAYDVGRLPLRQEDLPEGMPDPDGRSRRPSTNRSLPDRMPNLTAPPRP
jgi:hypothetical protein